MAQCADSNSGLLETGYNYNWRAGRVIAGLLSAPRDGG